MNEPAGQDLAEGSMTDRPSRGLAEAVRRTCLRAALQAHEDAGIQGLCAEGRWEAAVSAIRKADLEGVAERGPGLVSGRPD